MYRSKMFSGRFGSVFTLTALLCLAGCAGTTSHPAKVTVLHDADPAAADVVAYLESRHVLITKTADGATRIESSPQCRQALIHFMGIARQKMDTIAVNIANYNTTRDADGKPAPYRRQIVIITADGKAQTCADQSPFTTRFEPGHPDAGADGLVKYPNINLSIEFVDALAAVAQYEMAATILRRLDPTIVISQPPPAPPYATTQSKE